jgi:hypothetical protein
VINAYVNEHGPESVHDIVKKILAMGPVLVDEEAEGEDE